MWSLLLGKTLLAWWVVTSRAHGAVMQQKGFDLADHRCFIEVLSSKLGTDEPDETISVQCDGNTILIEDLADAEVEEVVVYRVDPVRIAINWERGTGAGITIVEAKKEASTISAKVIFEHFSKCGGKVLENGNVVVANVGRRFVGSEIFPEGTNVYRWNDGKYKFEGGFRWNKGARSNNQCILSSPWSCPAERSTKPLTDGY